jgi:type 1 glutamine amidotransferase
MKSRSLSLAFLLIASFAIAEEKPTKILFIGKEPDHPYGTHMYMHALGVLAKCAEKAEGVQTKVVQGWPEDKEQLKDVKSIVLYCSPAAEFLLDGPHREEFEKLAKGTQLGLVTIHWASSIKKENLERLGPAWTSYLGGTWVSNVGLSYGKSPLEQLKPDHPICRGWKEYEIEDEYYLNPTVGEATPLLRVKEPKEGKEVVVGWTYQRRGGGRAFATTLGHPYNNFQREPFRRMLVNAILWSAHVEVPKGGANVELSEEELKMPPEKK